MIGGYIPGPHGFDCRIVGYYRGKDLVYVARVRNGFVPASRRPLRESVIKAISLRVRPTLMVNRILNLLRNVITA